MFASIPAEKFDVILFNPPYLPTTRDEKLALADENAAYDGGLSGLEGFYRFSSQAPKFLAPKGKVAVIATSLDRGIEKSVAELEKQIGTATILAGEKFFFEKIALIEATKK
jgi:release factor glutamine methyltransferase